MKIRLGGFAGVLGAALFAGSAANATATLVGTTSDPAGINNLVVDGTTYDVAFSTTTLNSFTYESTLSIDASEALASALNTLSVDELNDFVSSYYYLDIDNSFPSDLTYCSVYHGSCTWYGPGTVTVSALGPYGVNNIVYIEAADFSVVPPPPPPPPAVPEPSSLPMLLAGLGLVSGVMYVGRKKENDSDRFGQS
jgi:hypothetical protein